MSDTVQASAFSSELMRALLNSGSEPDKASAFTSVRNLIENAIQQNSANEPAAKINSELLNLLNKLELTGKIIEQLKQNFSELNDYQKEKLSELNIPVENDFENPEKTASQLKNFNAGKILTAIQDAYKLIENNPDIKIKERDLAENLKILISKVIKEVDIEKTQTPAQLAEGNKNSDIKNMIANLPESLKFKSQGAVSSEKTEKILLFEKALDRIDNSKTEKVRAEGNANAKSVRMQLAEKNTGPGVNQDYSGLNTIHTKPQENLLKILSTVSGRNEYNINNDEKLRQIISQQIAQLKNIEETVKKLLISPSSEGQLTTLIKILDRIETAPDAGDNQLQKLFKEFIFDVKEFLKNFLVNKAPEYDIKDYLKNVLEKIYNTFKLEPIEVRLYKQLSLDDTLQMLKPEQVASLKLIESQVRLILNSPEGSLLDQVKTGGPGEVKLIVKSKELKALFEQIELFKKDFQAAGVQQEKPELVKSFENLQTKIRQLISEQSLPQSAEKEIRKVIVNFQSNFNGQMSLSELIEKTEEISANKLSFRQVEQLKLITDLIKQTLNSVNLIEAGNIAESPNVRKLLESMPLKNLLQALTKIDQQIPNPENNVETELVDFAGDLLNKIQADKHITLKKLSEHLSSAIDKLENSYILKDRPEHGLPLSKLDLNILRNLENISAGQEMFNRLNPVLQKTGEPVVLLFPFVMQGILSRMEVVFDGKSIKDRKKKRKTGRQVKGNYRHMGLRLTLPALGKVCVKVVYNSEEVLISLDFEKPEISEMLSGQVMALENSLYKLGYEKVQVKCGNSVLMTPDSGWITRVLAS